eukprot:1483102-Pleurochrysis_carterae.AAC.1
MQRQRARLCARPCCVCATRRDARAAAAQDLSLAPRARNVAEKATGCGPESTACLVVASHNKACE